MRLENAEICQWEMKLDSDLTAKVELTIRADVVSIPGMPAQTFASPIVRTDFENYISKYEFGDGLVGGEKTKSELFDELCKLRLENEELKEKVKDLEEGLKANREEQKEWRQRFLNMRNALRGLIDSEYGVYLPDDKIISHFYNLVKSFKDLTDKKYELSKELDSEKKSLNKSEIERAKLEKDLMAVADILQVGGLRSVNDILDKAHYWVHERSIDDEELKMILKMDLDACREEILDRIEEFCRFRDDVKATLGTRDCDEDESDILYELSRAALLAEKAEFICGYFDVKQIPLTSLAENLCIEIKEKVISEYKAEAESKRQDAIRDAAKKAGSLGNGIYLDGLTVEQNLRAENVRLKAECDEYKARIKELEGSLDCIHCESAAALGYGCE